jgi:hypothetical protein
MIPEKGQQHLAAQIQLWCVPTDVEKVGIGRGLAPLQNVEPPGVVGSSDAHVIRHDVQDLSHAVACECGDLRSPH